MDMISNSSMSPFRNLRYSPNNGAESSSYALRDPSEEEDSSATRSWELGFTETGSSHQGFPPSRDRPHRNWTETPPLPFSPVRRSSPAGHQLLCSVQWCV